MNEPLKTYADVKAFHEAFGVNMAPYPMVPPIDRKTLRIRLVTEEYHEFIDAIQRDDLVDLADAIADSIYVLQGTALEYGIDMTPVWNEVQRSNMSKLDEDGNPVVRDDGKILKSERFTSPDIASIIKLQIAEACEDEPEADG